MRLRLEIMVTGLRRLRAGAGAICVCALLTTASSAGYDYLGDDPGRHRRTGATESDICPGQPRAGTLRQNIVDAAMAEWSRFGFQIYDISARGLPALPHNRHLSIRPDAALPTPEHVPRVLRLGKREAASAVDDVIAGYWLTTPQGTGVIRSQEQVRAIRGMGSAGWITPWSAAFVSAVMCRAGLSSEQFRRSATHIEYLRHARDAPGRSAFTPHPLGPGSTIAPGDLICAGRAGNAGMTFETFAIDTDGPVATHCDIVVEIDRRRRKLLAIGGNVIDSVSMTVVPVTLHGRRAMPTATEHRPWFLHLRLEEQSQANYRRSPIVRPAPDTGGTGMDQ